MAYVKYLNEQVDRDECQERQGNDDDLGHPFAKHNGNGTVIGNEVALDVFQVLDNFPDEKQQLQKGRVGKYHLVKILVVHEYTKERKHRQQRGGKVAYQRVLF